MIRAALPGQERQSPDQGGAFMPAEMPADRGVVILPEDATAKIAAFRDAQAVRLALSSSEEQGSASHIG